MQPFVPLFNADQLHFEVLAVLLFDIFQDQSGKERLNGRDHGKAADDQGREIRDKACLHILHPDRG